MEIRCDKISHIIPKENRTFGEYINYLYTIYKDELYSEIEKKKWKFKGKPITVFNELNHNLQHQSFEHITTKGSTVRLYNEKRCERILWIRDMLNHVCDPCPDFRMFEDTKWRKNKKKRYIVWCVSEKYVIILEEREKEVKIISAYYVLYPDKESELEVKYKSANH